MPSFNFLPSGDFRNEGWNLVGSAVSQIYQAINNDDDTKYIQAPSSKGEAAVTFPVDTTSVPDGAVIVSVTVKARVAIGSGSAPTGAAPSVTFSVAAQDNTSRFTTRTIYPTSTSPQTFDVATYTRDALGNLWDVFRLNFLFCKIFTFHGIFDLCRIFKLFCEIKYRTRPTVTVTAPSGTVPTASPVVAWNYTQSDGDKQHHADIKIFTADTVSQIGFNPEFSTPVYETRVDGDIRSFTLPTSLNSNSYWVYVKAHSAFQAYSLWNGKQFTVNAPSPGIPGVTDPNGGDPYVEVVHDSTNGAASLTLRDTSNMLSASEGDAENADEPAMMRVAGSAAVARDATTAFPGGTASWKLVANSTSTATAYSDYQEVMAGQPFTGTVQVRPATTARTYNCSAIFYDAQFNVVGTITGTNVAGSLGTWVNPTVTGTIPGGSVYARVSVNVLTPVNTEVHNFDRLGLMYGTNVPWSDGGQMSRNLLSAWYTMPGGTQPSGTSWVAGPATTTGTNAAIGTGFSGTLCNKMTYVGATPSIAYRAAGTVFTSATSGNDYTLNKPAGVVSGDFLLAFITSSEAAGAITPPAGWELQSASVVDDGSTDTALFVLKRNADGTEPASWTGVIGNASSRRTAVVVAYSGAGGVVSDTTVSTGTGTPAFASTSALANSDPTAWRVSAFAVSDDASGSTLTANRNAPTATAPITFVGTGAMWGNNNSGTAYTLNKPSGIVTGDLMIGFVSLSGDASTFNVPSGWTLLSKTVANAGSSSTGYTQAVVYRIATGSEPSSWSSSVSGAIGKPIITRVLAYRNVNTTTPFIAQSGNAAANGTSITSNSVTNTNSSAWRVSFFGAKNQSTASQSWTSNESVERFDVAGGYDNFFGTDDIIGLAVSDSNGPVSTGAYTRTGTAARSWNGAGAWVGILNPANTAPVGADETVRATANSGASNPWMTTRVFDSAGVIPVGSQAITGIWSGSDYNSIAGWQGILQPASPVTSGFASATMNSASRVDLSAVDWSKINTTKMTVTASMLGNTDGASYLAVNFYRANQLLATKTAPAGSFNATYWSKSAATFEIPTGTTRASITVSASEREVNDVVYFSRLSLAFGEDTTYRAGTSRSTHPIWARPEIQYADDYGTGYGPFADLPGSKINPPAFEQLSGDAYYIDHTPIPLTNRVYRGRTETLGLNGDVFVSDWGPQSREYNFVARNWWLKDLRDPENNIMLKVAWDSFTVTTANTATVFQPIGEDLPVVLTEGYKGDSFNVRLIPVNHDEWFALRAMLKSGRTLFLQTDIDHAWWVRPVGDLAQTVLATGRRQEDPQRSIEVNFIQVEAEL